VRARIIIASASIGGIALAAWGALARVNHDIDEAFGDWPFLPADLVGVKASAESFGAGGAKMGADLRNANQTIQTEQINSQSNSRIKSGRFGN
jgi:hypothetical protein